MRFFSYLAILALLFLTACRSPEFRSFRESPPPVEVVVNITAVTEDARYMEAEFAAALRARLAAYVTVVPEGVTPPPDAVRLSVEIDSIRRGRVSGAAVGTAVGATVGVLSAAAGNRHAGFDGLFWGLWTGVEVGEQQRHQARMLGFVPPRINGYVSLAYPNNPRPTPIYTDRIPPRAIIDEMTPMRGDERYEHASVNENLARAFARAVINQLQYKFNWYPKRTLSWYEPEAGGDE